MSKKKAEFPKVIRVGQTKATIYKTPTNGSRRSRGRWRNGSCVGYEGGLPSGRNGELVHSHPAYLTYFLTSGKAKFTDADGHSTEREIKAGAAKWTEPEKHSVEFLSPAFSLVVEVKKPTGKKAPAGADPVKVAGDAYKVVIENDQVRLLEVRGKAGTKIPLHVHPAYVAYNVNDMKAEFADGTGKTQEVTSKAGEALWKEPEAHAVTMESDDARVLVLELKQ